jgi:hypothetical protein
MMSKDLLAALRRISMVAHYGLEQRESRDEMASTLAYIIEEVTEAINNAKEQDQ